MTNILRQIAIVVFVAIALMACGKNEAKVTTAQASTNTYGKEGGQCFAGILRAADAKHFTPTDFKNWKDKLNDKDKDWLNGFFNIYTAATKVANAHFGTPPKQLYDSKLITLEQLNVLEGFVNVYLESDPQKAGDSSANACKNVGFTKGADLS